MKKKQKQSVPTLTEEQFNALDAAYQYFNALFNGELPGCVLNFSRKRNTYGFLAPGRWRRVGEDTYSAHEISLTPTTLYREPAEVFSTLVHELCHLWQVEFGSLSRGGYHNKEWADKMEEVGLMPSDTGEPGGKRTGQHKTHYIIPGGRYEQVFQIMPMEYVLPFTSLDGDLMKSLLTGTMPPVIVKPGEPEPGKAKFAPVTGRNKTKYSCPSCGVNVWGKPGINLVCGDCNETFQVVG